MKKYIEKGFRVGPAYITLSFFLTSLSYGFGINRLGGYINLSPFHIDIDILTKGEMKRVEEMYKQLSLDWDNGEG